MKVHAKRLFDNLGQFNKINTTDPHKIEKLKKYQSYSEKNKKDQEAKDALIKEQARRSYLARKNGNYGYMLRYLHDILEKHAPGSCASIYTDMMKANKTKRNYSVASMAKVSRRCERTVKKAIAFLVKYKFIKRQGSYKQVSATLLNDIAEVDFSFLPDSDAIRVNSRVQKFALFKLELSCKLESSSNMQNDFAEKTEIDSFEKIAAEKRDREVKDLLKKEKQAKEAKQREIDDMTELVIKTVDMKLLRQNGIGEREIRNIVVKSPLGIGEVIESLMIYCKGRIDQPETFKDVTKPVGYIVSILQRGQLFTTTKLNIMAQQQQAKKRLILKKQKDHDEIVEKSKQTPRYSFPENNNPMPDIDVVTYDTPKYPFMDEPNNRPLPNISSLFNSISQANIDAYQSIPLKDRPCVKTTIFSSTDYSDLYGYLNK